MKAERRSIFKKMLGSLIAITGINYAANASTNSVKKEVFNVVTDDQEIPLFSGATKLNNMVFIAGKGAHFAGDIKAHTDHVLKELEKELIHAGSSMEKVLKVTVYLNDIADYKAMNEVYKGRFGKKPPVRSTIAVAKGGVPGDSLVEMDCIAYI